MLTAPEKPSEMAGAEEHLDSFLEIGIRIAHRVASC